MKLTAAMSAALRHMLKYHPVIVSTHVLRDGHGVVSRTLLSLEKRGLVHRPQPGATGFPVSMWDVWQLTQAGVLMAQQADLAWRKKS